jgi:hypothetical protein
MDPYFASIAHTMVVVGSAIIIVGIVFGLAWTAFIINRIIGVTKTEDITSSKVFQILEHVCMMMAGVATIVFSIFGLISIMGLI